MTKSATQLYLEEIIKVLEANVYHQLYFSNWRNVKKTFLGLTPEKNERAVSKDKFVIKKLGWNFDLWNLLAFKSRNGNSKHLRSLPFPFLLFINDALCAHYVPFHYHLTPIYMCKERERETDRWREKERLSKKKIMSEKRLATPNSWWTCKLRRKLNLFLKFVKKVFLMMKCLKRTIMLENSKLNPSTFFSFVKPGQASTGGRD